MSDLSKITILNVSENYCDIEIEQYVNNEDTALNEGVKSNEQMRSATLLAFLLDLATYNKKSNKTVLAIAEFGEPKYDLSLSKELIRSSEILEWITGPPDLSNPDLKSRYDELIKYETPEAVLLEMRQMRFVTRVHFNDLKWLHRLEKGMEMSTTLDTWVSDWL